MIRRKKPLAKGKPPRRSPVPRTRTTPRRQANRCPALLEWVRHQRCWTGPYGSDCHRAWSCGQQTIEAAHLPHTKRLGGDLFNVIPLCWDQHRRQHQIGLVSWLAEVGRTMDELRAAAREYTVRFAAETGYKLPGALPPEGDPS